MPYVFCWDAWLTGPGLRDQARLSVLTEVMLKISEIEGEHLNMASMRSSITRLLAYDIGALAPVDRHVEGVVEMVFDATLACHQAFTRERLCGWHGATMPPAPCSWFRVLSIVPSCISKPRQPNGSIPKSAISLTGADGPSGAPPLIRAGLAYLWLVTLHPFDEDNGRVARAEGDLFLARADSSLPTFSQPVGVKPAEPRRIRKNCVKGTMPEMFPAFALNVIKATEPYRFISAKRGQ